MLRHEDRIGDRDGLRSGALQAADIPAVVIDHDVADRNETPGQRRRPVLAGNQRREDEPGGAVDAARPRPAARNLDAAVDHFDLWRRRVGDGEQIVRIVPDLLLRLEREERRHPAEADRQRPAPAGAAAGAAEFEADLRELGRTVFVAAETRSGCMRRKTAVSRSASIVSAGTRLAFSAASARDAICGRRLRTRARICAKSGRTVAGA